jgi:hypothetical protein
MMLRLSGLKFLSKALFAGGAAVLLDGCADIGAVGAKGRRGFVGARRVNAWKYKEAHRDDPGAQAGNLRISIGPQARQSLAESGWGRGGNSGGSP